MTLTDDIKRMLRLEADVRSMRAMLAVIAEQAGGTIELDPYNVARADAMLHSGGVLTLHKLDERPAITITVSVPTGTVTPTPPEAQPAPTDAAEAAPRKATP